MKPRLLVPSLALFALGALPARAIDEVRPTEPAGKTVVPARPEFNFAVKGEFDGTAKGVIEVSRDHWKTVAKTWDMRQDRLGWAMRIDEDERGGRFRPAEGLAEGDWEWRITVYHNGAQYQGAKPASFRVDATPPAEVDGLRMKAGPNGAVILTWEPVVYDVEGKPETVAAYVVYRYDTRGIFSNTRMSEAGRTESLIFTDPAPLLTTIELRAKEEKAQKAEEAAARKRTPPRSPSPASRAAAPGGASKTAGVPTMAANGAPKAAPAGKTAPETSRARASRAPWKRRKDFNTIYYKVVAVDSVGNELGKREISFPAGSRPSIPDSERGRKNRSAGASGDGGNQEPVKPDPADSPKLEEN